MCSCVCLLLQDLVQSCLRGVCSDFKCVVHSICTRIFVAEYILKEIMEKMEALLDRHFINGELVPPVQGQYLDVVDPAEESVWGRSAAGTNSQQR